MIADLPVTCSTCITQNGQLMAMALGGYNLDLEKNPNSIYMYNTETIKSSATRLLLDTDVL